jgi:hypothetical protein
MERMNWPEPQTTFQGYNARVRNAAWGEVYARGGLELYCRDRFTAADAQARRVNDYGPLNSSHGDSPYGELPGEQYRRFTEYCSDFERGTGSAPDLVDPTDAARGDLARAILYMHYVYGLPFDDAVDDPEHHLAWANADPVNAAEIRREDEIERLQPGTRSPLIGEGGVS